MFFQLDDTGDKGNGVKSFSQACAELQITPVPTITEQTQDGFCFELHTGMHGNPVIYVNKTKKADRISRNVPSIKIGPPTEWQRGQEKFSNREASDALTSVEDNQAVMLQVFNAWVANVLDDDDFVPTVSASPSPPPAKKYKILPVEVKAPQPNPFNIQATKEYVFNETGNIMFAKTIDGSAEMEKNARQVFAEVSVFFAAMTRAMSTTVNPTTQKLYSIYDYEAMSAIISGSGLFVHVTEEDVTHTATSWGVTFSKDLIEALLGLATGQGELGFAHAMIASMGKRGLQIGASKSKSDSRVSNIVFVCEYLFGMPSVSAIVVYIDSNEHSQAFHAGPCVTEQSTSITLKMHKDTYLFVTPKFIKEYAGDLLSIESDLQYLELVDYLQDLVERKPIITAVETLDGVKVTGELEKTTTYVILGAFLDPTSTAATKPAAPALVAKFIGLPTGVTATVTLGEVQSNVVSFTVTGGPLTTACVIGLYESKLAAEPFIVTPIAFTIAK